MGETQSEGSTARYGVVVCPKCRHARGLELQSEATLCGRCGKRSPTRSLQILYRAKDSEELQAAVGAVEARVTGGEAALMDLKALQEEVQAKAQQKTRPRAPPTDGDDETLVQWAASRAAGEQGTESRARRIIAALDEAQKQGFTAKQLEAAFDAAGLPGEKADTEIRRGLVRDELYEPRPGRLKRL